MQSMTGFGRSSITTDSASIEVNVKSVNGRFLEIRTHLPKKYVAFESEVLKAVKSHLQRGTVDIYVQRHAGDSAEFDFHFNTDLAKKWLASFRKSAAQLKVADTFSSKDLLVIPEFVQTVEKKQMLGKEKTALEKALVQALKACADERRREGDFLAKTCRELLRKIGVQVSALTDLREDFIAAAESKYSERINRLMGEFKAEPARLVQEVAHLVEKTDIQEELHRLQEHVDSMAKLLGDKDTQGKKLDFYAQELLREINTIGSKSPSAKIIEYVVNAKNLIEQLREQIQNIE